MLGERANREEAQERFRHSYMRFSLATGKEVFVGATGIEPVTLRV